MSNVAEASLASTPAQTRVRDFVALTKPRITLMVLTTTAGGCSSPPLTSTPRTLVCTLLGMALIVGGANALNMVIERDIDRHMTRTRLRPLPAGRYGAQAGARLRRSPSRSSPSRSSRSA